LFGYGPGDLVGRMLDDLLKQRSVTAPPLPPDTRHQKPNTTQQTLMLGQHKNGSELLLEVRLGPRLPVAPGRLAETVILHDVTKTRQTSEMLCAREAHLRLIVEQMPAILWTTDKRLHITSILGAGLATLEVRPEELIGLSMLECLDSENVESTPIA